jgi:hypothetical protein
MNDAFDYMYDARQFSWDILVVRHWERHPHGIEIATPIKNSTVKGTVNVTVWETGSFTRAELLIDGALAGSSEQSPFSFPWETWKTSPGVHTLRVIGYWNTDGSVLTYYSPNQNVTVEAAGHAKIVLDAPAEKVNDSTYQLHTVEGWPPAYSDYLTGTLTNEGDSPLTWSDMGFAGAWDPSAACWKDGEYHRFLHHDMGGQDPPPITLQPSESIAIRLDPIPVYAPGTTPFRFQMDDGDASPYIVFYVQAVNL